MNMVAHESKKNKRIFDSQESSTAQSASQRTYRKRTDMDQELSSTKSQHQRLRVIWKAATGKGVQTTSGFTVSHLRPAGISKKGRIHKEEIETLGTLRNTYGTGKEMADGRQICTSGMLCRQGR